MQLCKLLTTASQAPEMLPLTCVKAAEIRLDDSLAGSLPRKLHNAMASTRSKLGTADASVWSFSVRLSKMSLIDFTLLSSKGCPETLSMTMKHRALLVFDQTEPPQCQNRRPPPENSNRVQTAGCPFALRSLLEPGPR